MAFALGAFAYYATSVSEGPLASDPADYVYASESGIGAAYFDSGSVGLWGAARIWREQPEARAHLWDYLERRGDVASFRHFHSAAGFYLPALAASAHASELQLRMVAAAEGAAAVGVTFAGLSMIGVALPLATIATALTALSPAVVVASSDVTPHPLFLCFVLLFAFALARFLQNKDRRTALLAAGALALCVATLELSLVALVAVPFIFAPALLRPARVVRDSVFRFSLGVFALTLFFAWPGGVINGGYGLSYGVFLFQALLRRGSYFAPAGPMTIAFRAAQDSVPVLATIVLVAGATVFLVLKRRVDPAVRVLAWLALGFLAQGVLNRFSNQTYAAHFIGLFWPLAAAVGQSFANRFHNEFAAWPPVVALGVLLVSLSPWLAAREGRLAQFRADGAAIRDVIEHARRAIPARAVILTNSEHEAWRYYLRSNRIEQTSSADSLTPRNPDAIPPGYWTIIEPALLDAKSARPEPRLFRIEYARYTQ